MIMKKLILPVAFVSVAIMAMTSCAPLIYQQITTLSSDDVTMEDGDFIASTHDCTVEYDFWSECGNFVFFVTNNSDRDIFIDMTKSFFIRNGIAYDYYPGETSDMFKTSLVCIPAHSTKYFSEYSASDVIYRDCGFVRDPSRKELAIMKFDRDGSPLKLENRLTFVIDGNEMPVNHTFYASEIQNISENSVITSYNIYNCNGTRSLRTAKMHEKKAKNRYFIRYMIGLEEDNDRMKGQ